MNDAASDRARGEERRRQRAIVRVLLAWLPAVAYMALIWWLSSMPITLPMPSIPWRDKLAHALEYGILGFLIARAVLAMWPGLAPLRGLVAAALLTSVWGYLDEVHQAFVPGRDANALDLLADAVGAVLGAACYGAVWLVLRRRRRA